MFLSVSCLGTLCILQLLLLHKPSMLSPFNGLFSRTTWVSRYGKGKTSLDLNEARGDGVWDGSGISWTICKQSAPRSRQITMPAPHHSVFLQAGCPSCQPTNSVKTLKACVSCRFNKSNDYVLQLRCCHFVSFSSTVLSTLSPYLELQLTTLQPRYNAHDGSQAERAL